MAKRKKTKEEHYLSNEELLKEVLRAKKLNRITPELGRMIILLTEKYGTHPWWCGYSPGWLEEMKSEAVVALCRGILKFDPEFAIKRGKKPNIFAYSTTLTYRSFKSTRDKLKKYSAADEILPPGLF